MKKLFGKLANTHLNILIWVSYVVGMFWFIELHYKYWYHFMEQYSLFLYTKAYFLDLLVQPGGFNEYLSGFITQFFYLPYGAGALIALLSGGIGWGFYCYLRKFTSIQFIVLALLPLFICWYYPLESIASLTAIWIGLVIVLGCISIRDPKVRIIVEILGITICYFIAVPVHFLVGGLLFVFEIFSTQKLKIGYSLILPVYSCLLPLVALRFVYVIPIREAFVGKFLFHPEYPLPFSFYLFGIAFLVVAILSVIIPKAVKSILGNRVSKVLIILIIPIICGIFILKTNTPLEQSYQYDYYARFEKWEEIVKHAKREGIKDINSLVYVNLASSYIRQFNENLLLFPQAGVDGLIPQEPVTRMDLIQASEVSWQLNHINSAQRFGFVGVLSSQRGVQPRLMKRLVQTYLVNGEYRVAEKYIKILESTLFYKEWAEQHRVYLSPELTESTSWIVQKRGLLSVTDNLFDLTKTFPNAVASLIDDHTDNKPAFEYGMGYLLLKKDLPVFMHYMELQKENKQLPLLYQEAICMYYGSIKNDPTEFRTFPINEKVFTHFAGFVTSSKNNPPAALKGLYGNSYFYYYRYINTP